MSDCVVEYYLPARDAETIFNSLPIKHLDSPERWGVKRP